MIVAAGRTAVGKFGGSLAKIAAADLGAHVIKGLLAKTGMARRPISEVIMGQVLTAGGGQNPARQAVIKAGLPHTVPGDDHQQGLRQRPEGDPPGGPGDPVRRCRHRHRRRPGKHERLAARAERFARRLPHGRRQAGRHHDRRRPVGRLQPVPHGHHGRERRQEVRHLARSSRTSSPLASQNKAEAAQKAGRFKDEIVPFEIAQKKGTGRLRQPTNSSSRRPRRSRWPGCAPPSTRKAR